MSGALYGSSGSVVGGTKHLGPVVFESGGSVGSLVGRGTGGSGGGVAVGWMWLWGVC